MDSAWDQGQYNVALKCIGISVKHVIDEFFQAFLIVHFCVCVCECMLACDK